MGLWVRMWLGGLKTKDDDGLGCAGPISEQRTGGWVMSKRSNKSNQWNEKQERISSDLELSTLKSYWHLKDVPHCLNTCGSGRVKFHIFWSFVLNFTLSDQKLLSKRKLKNKLDFGFLKSFFGA